MTSKETVGEYLIGARTLVKSKIKNIAVWNSMFDEAMQQTLKFKTDLKTQKLRRVSQFKKYKDFFNNIEDDFAGKDDTATTTVEVNEIYTWNKTTSDDPTEAEMLAKVNEVYHRYGQYPPQRGYWTPQPRPQGSRQPFRGGRAGLRPFNHRYQTPQHQNTTVVNQAYTLNGTTPHANVNYTPGTFNIGAPFSTQHPVTDGYQVNQPHTQYSQQSNNSFAEKQNNTTTQAGAAALVEQLQQIINIHKNQTNQENKVQVAKPQPITTLDLKTAAEHPVPPEDKSE